MSDMIDTTSQEELEDVIESWPVERERGFQQFMEDLLTQLCPPGWKPPQNSEIEQWVRDGGDFSNPPPFVRRVLAATRGGAR